MTKNEQKKSTNVTAYSVHPDWARSNFGSGGNFLMRTLMAAVRPFTKSMTDSNEDSAQTSLHCLISDDVPKFSGQYFSQSSVLYSDKECKQGGWPMKTPNPNARDMNAAKELVKLSYNLVGLKEK